MKREFCARCALKHIGQARALMLETRKGYPSHVWFAQGHLAEAEDEIVELMPDEAEKIREARLAIDNGLRVGYIEVPNWEGLMAAVAEGAMLEETLCG